MALLLLMVYMAIDALLTIACLNYGGNEINRLTVLLMRHVSTVPGIILFRVITCIIIAILIGAIHRVERAIDIRNVAYTSTTLLTVFYVYVLIHNLVCLKNVT